MIPGRLGNSRLEVLDRSRIPKHQVCLQHHYLWRLLFQRRLQHIVCLLYLLAGLPADISGDPLLLPHLHRRYRCITLTVTHDNKIQSFSLLRRDRQKRTAPSGYEICQLYRLSMYPCRAGSEEHCQYHKK